jgi:hypothetical protein
MRKAIFSAGAILFVGVRAYAIGLAMRFSDVTLENVPPGTVMNLRTEKYLPLVIQNQDDSDSVDVVIEPVSPESTELKESYEPIPDPTWIRTVPNRFHLGPKASASADVILQVPDDPKLIGHHYEVVLWVHSDTKNKVRPEGGVLFQVALRSRFRISVGTVGPAALQREKAQKKLATINANFSVNPDNIFVQNVPLGKEVDLKAVRKASLKVVNQSDDPIDLRFHTVEGDPNISPQAGYSYAPDFRWLKISPEKFHVDGNSIKDLKLSLSIPNLPANHNKKYMFLVQTTLSDQSLPLVYYNMVYVTTEP